MRKAIIGRRGFAIAMAATLLLGAACADDGGAEPAAAGSGPDEATATGSTTTEADPTGVAGAGGGRYDYGPGGGDGGEDGGEDGSGVEADVTADNFAFAPSGIEAAAGSELSVGNANPTTTHTFTIDGTNVDVELEPMAVERIALDLDPGAYDFRCRFHASMTGTLTIA